jgi:MSHA biogenesis protein MshI
MASWIRTGRAPGWTAVAVEADGLYGVSVATPKAPTDRPRVINCGFVENGGLDLESLTALSKQISVSGFPWAVTLSREAYSFLVVPEPSVKPDELDQAVRWGISTMINYPAIEADVAWMKIPTHPSQPNRPPQLYVAAARHEQITTYADVFKRAKLSLQAIDVSETAHRNIAALIERPGEGIALLRLGALGVQFTVTFQGELFLDRFVNETITDPGMEDLARERASERVVLQVQRSLDFVGRSLPFIDLNRVLLAPMQHDPGLRKYFEQNLPIPVEDIDLAAVFDMSSAPDLLNSEIQAGYFVVLGAALRFRNQSFVDRPQ